MTYISFLSENRRNVEVPSTEGDATILGGFRTVELIYEANFEHDKPDTAIGTFVAPVGWIQSILMPGDKPLDSYPGARKARWVSIQRNSGYFSTLLLDEFTADPYGDGTALVTFNAYDERLWFENFPSKSGTNGTDLTGTRTALLRALTQRLSYDDQPGKEDWKKVPMVAFDPNWVPSAAQQAQGIVRGSTEDPGGNITIAAPDPLPIGDAIGAVFNQWPDHSIFPLREVGIDGTLAPFGRWVLKKRIKTTRLFTERNGGLKVISYGGTNRYTDVLSYLNRDQTIHRYTGGTEPSNLDLTRAWLGVDTKGYNLPEASNPGDVLPGANTPPDRTDIDTTIDFGGEEFPPGGTGYVRIDDDIYEVPFDTVTESPGSSVGAGIIDTDDITRLVDTRKIAFAVNGESFYIPFRWHYEPNTGTRYWPAADISIYVDGKYVQDFIVAARNTEETTPRMVQLTFETAGNHLIELKPRSDVYTVGWGRAFGWWNNTINETQVAICDRASNRSKLVRILTDPDFAHMASDNTTSAPGALDGYGQNFRQWQYGYCNNLENAPDEDDIAQGFVTLGSAFRSYQYYSCSKLRSTGDFGSAFAVVRIDASYRLAQFQNCVKLKKASGEGTFNSLVTAGGNFMNQMYSNCPELVTPGSAADFPVLKTLESPAGSGVGFKWRQFVNCPKLSKDAGLGSFPVLEDAGDHFLEEQYSIHGITQVDWNVSFPELKTVKVSFMAATFSGGAKLTKASMVANFPKVTTIADSFMGAGGTEDGLFANAPLLTEAKVTVNFLLATSVGANFMGRTQTSWPGTAVQGMFVDCVNLVKATINVQLPSVLTVGNTFMLGMFTRNSKLTDVQVTVNLPVATTLGNFFFGGVFRFCTTLQAAVTSLTAPAVTTIGSFFFSRTYQNCTKLLMIPTEGLPSGVTAIGSDYRREEFINCTTATGYSNENEDIPATLTTVGANFRFAMFSGCTSLTSTMREGMTGAVTIGANFRQAEYTNCTSLTTIIPEKSVIWPTGGVINYRLGRFIGCSSYNDVGAQIGEVATRVPSQVVTGYRSQMLFGTGLSKAALRTVKYVDGTSMIEGFNGITSNFYPA